MLIRSIRLSSRLGRGLTHWSYNLIAALPFSSTDDFLLELYHLLVDVHVLVPEVLVFLAACQVYARSLEVKVLELCHKGRWIESLPIHYPNHNLNMLNKCISIPLTVVYCTVLYCTILAIDTASLEICQF